MNWIGFCFPHSLSTLHIQLLPFPPTLSPLYQNRIFSSQSGETTAMASTSTLVASSTTSKILSKRNTNLLNPIPKPTLLPQIPKSLTKKSVSITAVVAMAAASPLPALAAEIEKAALFDFNLTLPAIAIEFLLLMVALDKIYFTPLGKFMDERDAAIRAKLGDVKDTSTEVKQLDEQAAAVMKAARAEISAALNAMKKETSAELDAKLAEGRKRVEAELAEALASLEKQKEETIKALDSQIAALSNEIVKKVLPAA